MKCLLQIVTEYIDNFAEENNIIQRLAAIIGHKRVVYDFMLFFSTLLYEIKYFREYYIIIDAPIITREYHKIIDVPNNLNHA